MNSTEWIKNEIKDKNYFVNKTLYIETLTPIHIGNGEEIINWSYGIFDGEVYIYDFEEIIKNLDKELIKELTNLIINNGNSFIKNLGDFIRLKEKNLKNQYLYKVELKGVFQNSSNKKIFEFIKTKDYKTKKLKVYIPASEIKGAIRTAILYYVLKTNKDIFNHFVNSINGVYRKTKNNKRAFQKAINKLANDIENIIFNNNKKNPQYSFMKYLQISDTFLDDEISNPENCLIVKDIEIVNSRKRSELHELVKPETTFEFKLAIPNKNYKNKLKNNYPKINILENIAKACNEFAKDLLEEEIKYWKNLKENKKYYREAENSIRILEDIKNTLNNLKQNEFIIRLGKHEGFLSTTIGLLIKNTDEDLYKKIYPLLVNRGYYNFPNKTRKLTIDNEPLGWCLIAKDVKHSNSLKSKQNTRNNSNTSNSKSWEEAINKLKSSGRFKVKE